MKHNSKKQNRNKFDVSKPRRMYWSDEVENPDRCPKCFAKLEEGSHTYLMVIAHSGTIDSFHVGGGGGYFCAHCPVVVLARPTFDLFAEVAMRSSKRFKYDVLGIVDLDAVPEEKRHLPFDEENNPLPLVPFLEHASQIRYAIKRDNQKVGRNEPCPCGSGKKYKKCCAFEEVSTQY